MPASIRRWARPVSSGFHSQNEAAGLPYINGLLIMNEPATGIPAIMDATWITAARTAAPRSPPAAWQAGQRLRDGLRRPGPGYLAASPLAARDPSRRIRSGCRPLRRPGVRRARLGLRPPSPHRCRWSAGYASCVGPDPHVPHTLGAGAGPRLRLGGGLRQLLARLGVRGLDLFDNDIMQLEHFRSLGCRSRPVPNLASWHRARRAGRAPPADRGRNLGVAIL
jgi:hypothetical protein